MNRTRVLARQLGGGGVHPELAAHPEVRQDRIAVLQRQPQVLAAPARLAEAASGQGGGKVLGPGSVTPNRTRMEDAHGVHPTARDDGRETAPDGLDLRAPQASAVGGGVLQDVRLIQLDAFARAARMAS